jgi:hypothetical protein
VAAELGLAQEVLALIASEPDVLEELRRSIGAPPAYTVATLAAALSVSERVIRNRDRPWRADRSQARRPVVHRAGCRGRVDARRAAATEGAVSVAASSSARIDVRATLRGRDSVGVGSAVAVSVHRKGAKWVVRYRDGPRNRSRSFDRKGDADRFEAGAARRKQLGVLASLDGGRETLDEFVTETWAPTHGVTLTPKTRRHYASLYDHHIAPALGPMQLRTIRAETVARWQADRLAGGAGPVAVRQALDLLGSVLQRVVESERISANPVRLVRRARLPRRKEVRPARAGDD